MKCFAPQESDLRVTVLLLPRNTETTLQVGIPTAVYYPIPMHRQPVFSELNLTQTSLDISEAVAPRVLSLPMGADLDEEVQNCIVSALREATISHSEKLTT